MSVDAADEVAHEVVPRIERLARLGFAAKGLLYATIGLLAAGAGLGLGGKVGADKHGALAVVMRAPFGRILLAVIAAGLLGYAVWRIVEGITDAEHHGRGLWGAIQRVGDVGTGAVHLALAVTAARWSFGGSRDAGDSASSETWTARALALPGGTLVIWAVAAGFVGYGLHQLYCAYTAQVGEQLRLGGVPRNTQRWILGVSRFGIGSRGLVFATIGVLLGRAADRHDPREAGGIADSLRELLDLGRWPFVATAVGLVAYGVYELINARYRRIHA